MADCEAKLYPNCDPDVWLRSCEEEVTEPVEGVITGELPAWLRGSLLRNGPGSLKVGTMQYQHLFDSAALLHRFAIYGGGVTYQCRFLRSETQRRNRAANRIVVAEFGTRAAPDPCHTIFDRVSALFKPSEVLSDNAMISVYPFGDEMYAFTEGPVIHRIDPVTLDTCERKNLTQCVAIINHTSHPHVMPNDEVAVVIVDNENTSRDIIVQRRRKGLQRIAETHRSYDALQYPLIFLHGEDGYHFNIKQIHPKNGIETNKKVTSKEFYAYRLMIRDNEVYNHILNTRRLFQQFLVDMYAKIEAERMLYIRLNQKKLRTEEYIHLRDAIVNDGNIDDIGTMVILPSSYIGSPRHMHEYTQDAMTYVRKYGRPDLFITFTCNSSWPEIKEQLKYGQTSMDRHDIIARVFRQNK
ncbi:Carotenoid isomerooxygenase [Eumeta japonica]|uniref:Carotenoid isomerooxygenase n=1 Tax=Eumeta variegata TaxID=151549 RepID=A0A4C1S841_EUMVA|nr:Carotenoid isomerooxygenase [Eumeta japonica]